ncbi:MAG TPA: hypothetical protein VGF71_18990, partial [Caulobacteraceae bacterium]
LRLLSGGAAAIRGIYLDAGDGALIQSYWRWLLVGTAPTDARGFSDNLRRPPAGAASPAARQFVAKIAELGAAIRSIEVEEAAMNDRLFQLYDLTDDERLLVQGG